MDDGSEGDLPRQPVSAWLTEHRRYYEYLDVALREVDRVADAIVQAWPDQSTDSIEVSKLGPEVHQMCRHRDLLGDAIPVFAAMSVESFLNLWGVQLLGEREFIARFKMESAVRKLKALSAMEGVAIDEEDRVLILLRAIMKRRHDLVHPKAREVPPSTDPLEWPRYAIVDRVRSQIADCKEFFERVRVLLPSTSHMLPDNPAA